MRLLRDSRGRPSWTLTLALPAALAITGRFLAGGVDVTVGPVHVAVVGWGGADYAMAVGVWLGLWAQREYVEKRTGASP